MKLVFLGAPGAGKGTVADKAASRFDLVHISTGEIFRAAIRSESPLGLKVKSVIESGGLVSDDLTIALVKERLSQEDVKDRWLLDGFPRTIPQAEALSEFCNDYHVINLAVHDEVVIERLCGRRMCKNCGKSYHIKFMPSKKEGVCDDCGGPLYIRDDDQESSIKTRLANYNKQTAPLVDFYTKKGILVSVDGEKDADTVWHNLETVVSGLK